MSIASLSFNASLPTYNSVGANGTTFANNTLAASGNVLVNTNDKSTDQASVLASGFSANGLNYSFQGYSLSGNTLSVIYGLSSSATDVQQAQASDEITALSGGLPGNKIDFASTGSVTGGDITSASYTVATTGVVGKTPTTTGSAFASGVSGDGNSLSIQSISTGPGNTIDVVFNLGPPTSTPAAPTTRPTSQDAGNAATSYNSGTAIASVLAGLPQGNPSLTAQATGQNSTSQNPGSLLANLLNPQAAHSTGIYDLVAGFSSGSGNSSSSSSGNTGNSLNVFA